MYATISKNEYEEILKLRCFDFEKQEMTEIPDEFVSIDQNRMYPESDDLVNAVKAS